MKILAFWKIPFLSQNPENRHDCFDSRCFWVVIHFNNSKFCILLPPEISVTHQCVLKKCTFWEINKYMYISKLIICVFRNFSRQQNFKIRKVSQKYCSLIFCNYWFHKLKFTVMLFSYIGSCLKHLQPVAGMIFTHLPKNGFEPKKIEKSEKHFRNPAMV